MKSTTQSNKNSYKKYNLFQEEKPYLLEEIKSSSKLKLDVVDNNLSAIKEQNFNYKNSPLIFLDSYKKKRKKLDQDRLGKFLTFEEILNYGLDFIKLKDDYFSKRIRELKELCDLEEDDGLSLESLKTMFLFIGSLESITKPSSLTLSETGIFYLTWRKDKKNSVSLRFQENYFVDYVIFKPSSYINKRIILNGSMYVIDMIDYLESLKIKLHQQ
ncbi:hypothetical protein [Spirulina sp. 06S082]|uniref:hypothetical protein n=1 Tax=Spirulina sp. 06S082 TaxID=3110248 RepID=UPI002B1FB733|nr:hypothetical protein [Spirulina sp. 06S082]MEA5469963.1 hypothetical protein [Spirulina sp. 06S082]